MSEVTVLLQRAQLGNPAAAEELLQQLENFWSFSRAVGV
jgi:hypothetical protein